ncbi:glycosylphosphatidylinositol anchor attachment 1 protein-like [Varroa destructor]|uniref:Glycosylphosphatidylinositol anchor attachment 1 protein n=1 Tax=Varroa destructor TaxID=109461 RepID=A0A7M7KEZ7_VARDE|nr:glycosylphosphatidylinositol anchor attachment 1 protein-like [Varroa destructor]XP_022665813.1 glycosylphosphatidylinositol anchor attachment 1 protein-like [Varroa destructor]XP_022665814.1 glycosylphosphatidylinositol anchor attachment 1 protein-like [Varroa destructor]
MGLLSSSDGQRPRLLGLLQRYSTVLCLLLYPIGLILFAGLAWKPLNERTYFSDNSLLPGMVERASRIAGNAESLLESLELEVAEHPGLPTAWLAGEFRRAGLEVYRHNFSLAYPFGTRQLYHGENLYAIMRAPRTSRTEAIVISVPFRNSASPHGSTLASIAAVLDLAKHFRRQLYWSKDIIFVITEHELVGLQAWLDAYHLVETSPGVILPGYLEARSGSIMAAVNLELQDKHIDQIDVKIFGLNGQLPNLDLVNTCKDLLLRERVPYVLEGRVDPEESRSFHGWKHAATNFVSQIAIQATGAPSAGHGLFHRFAIQALTLRGEPKVPGYRHVGLTPVGRVVEGLVRSVNNLLQRFHRSFFYYYLPSSDRYVSIAYYMTAFGFLTGGVLFKALALLLELMDQHPSVYLTLLWRALPFVLGLEALGAGLFSLVTHGVDIVKHLVPLYTQDALYVFTVAASSSLLLTPLFIRNAVHPLAQRLLMYLHFLLLVAPLSMLNISLGTIVAALGVPVVLTAGVNCPLPIRIMRRLLQFVTNPLLSSLLLIFCYAVVSETGSLKIENTEQLYRALNQALQGHRRLFLFALEDWYMYGAVTYPLFCLGFLPVWSHMWTL